MIYSRSKARETINPIGKQKCQLQSFFCVIKDFSEIKEFTFIDIFHLASVILYAILAN